MLEKFDWPEGKPFQFKDEPGEHDPCYVIMPDGAMLSLCHHAQNGIDQARAQFIVSACNEKLARIRTKQSQEVIEAAIRVAQIFATGCDRCDGADLTMLEKAGLMDQGICDDTFGQDTLEVGDPMWTFNDKGKALLKSLCIDL